MSVSSQESRSNARARKTCRATARLRVTNWCRSRRRCSRRGRCKHDRDKDPASHWSHPRVASNATWVADSSREKSTKEPPDEAAAVRKLRAHRPLLLRPRRSSWTRPHLEKRSRRCSRPPYLASTRRHHREAADRRRCDRRMRSARTRRHAQPRRRRVERSEYVCCQPPSRFSMCAFHVLKRLAAPSLARNSLSCA